MAEPVTTSAGAIFTIAKAWTILAGVFGSVVPILALSDQNKTSFKNALFMAIVGSSFAIFMGPWIADNANVHSTEGVVALSWALGAIGVYVIRAVLKWLDKRGEEAVDQLMQKVTRGAYEGSERGARVEVIVEDRRSEAHTYEGPNSSEEK
jgi:hypothetical protein